MQQQTDLEKFHILHLHNMFTLNLPIYRLSVSMKRLLAVDDGVLLEPAQFGAVSQPERGVDVYRQSSSCELLFDILDRARVDVHSSGLGRQSPANDDTNDGRPNNVV